MDVAVSPLGDAAGRLALYIGIDPGRDKSGWAVVDEFGGLRASGIFRSSEADLFFKALLTGSPDPLEQFLLERLGPWPSGLPSSDIVMGDGTGKEVLLSLAQSLSLRVKLIPERGTTLAARKLYWNLHPPRGLWRLVPSGLRVPSRDVDDLAAWAIVLNYLDILVQGTEGNGERHGNGEAGGSC